MQTADWIVLTLYLAGTVGVGVYLGRLVKNSSDLFTAGGKSPWWLSGLSAFMTMFSANTFVVWGGIAYEHGMVAVVINLCYGIAALLVGFTVAGKWKELGIATPAEYVDRRFGRGALHFYTWFMTVFRIVGTGGALYAIARLSLAVIAGPGGEGLSSTGLNIAILVFALIVVLYTMIGGLWSVLVTDALQFIVLNLAVIFVIPLSLMKVGGLSGFVEQAPEGFFAATSDQYTFLFLVGWVAIHYFMIGAEWAFVQRNLCVENAKAARRSNYLFGGLYLLSPLLWLLPPMLWRVQQPIPLDADAATVTRMSETAYILSCQAVLPAGMLGLMVAALFSATASMISSQLNVFSTVLTKNIYEPLANAPSDAKLLRVGRILTVVLGLLIALIAIATPYLGGAAALIISVTQVMVTPLLAPTLASLFFRRIRASAIWITVGVCFPLGLMAKLTDWLVNTPLGDTTVTGVVLPLFIVAGCALFGRSKAPEWTYPEPELTPQVSGDGESSYLPARILAICLAGCSLTLFALIPINTEARGQLAVFALALLLGAGALGWLSHKLKVKFT
jgi:Na+/proline symporter